MDRRPCLSRRRALGALALGSGSTLALGACGPDDEGFGNADPVQASDDAVALSEIPENATTLVNFGGEQPYVAIVRGSGKDISAMSGYCTHQGCALAVGHDGAELDCPCHGSRFDSTSGDVVRGPAEDPLGKVEVTLDGDQLRRVR
ncbi:ferredoxin [Brachybacterium endophyticum]|uniref:Cytochrome bc1 complex Rieske iron-sulfur subunit n=1 Tax=Brachybacterium endophyticum TaxID=2182385 RepID=A0A2U2RML6_9MICO|nr:Rieske (2Fe-2S) protein [Brachybacterium endophyticum]PWH07035.1 ferredoxin [Brachybacterium endophyticum]